MVKYTAAPSKFDKLNDDDNDDDDFLSQVTDIQHCTNGNVVT